MSQRKITSTQWDGDDLIVTGQLGDGTPDDDGLIVDPAWLHEAARQWILATPAIRDDQGRELGTAEATWPAGEVGEITMIRVRISTPHIMRMIRSCAINDFSFGMTSPVIVRDSAAPAGRLTSARLLFVGLEAPVIVAADQARTESSGNDLTGTQPSG